MYGYEIFRIRIVRIFLIPEFDKNFLENRESRKKIFCRMKNGDFSGDENLEQMVVADKCGRRLKGGISRLFRRIFLAGN